MATSTSALSPDIPRRVTFVVDVPEKLTSRTIAEVCNIAASRVRYELGQVYRQRIAERVAARVGNCPFSGGA